MTADSLPRTDQDQLPKRGKVHSFRPEYIGDVVLWNAFRNGDEQAFITLIDRFVKTLYNYGIKLHPDGDTVKDAVQELFIDLWKNRRNLGETDSIKLYLYKSLRRKLIRMKSTLASRLFTKLLSHHATGVDVPHESLLIEEQSFAEKRQQAMHLLDQLTKRQREAVFLRYFEEMEYEKIASIMDLSKQVVYNLVNKAIQSLKK